MQQPFSISLLWMCIFFCIDRYTVEMYSRKRREGLLLSVKRLEDSWPKYLQGLMLKLPRLVKCEESSGGLPRVDGRPF